VPEAKIDFAHGRMTKEQIENKMQKFIDNKFNVLVCTTIIETGIDIPNVNTLIIIDADRFGLSQLYQIRGRIGRSNRIGYATDEFKNLNLAKLSFCSVHWKDKTWIGTVNEVEKDDPYFAAKLRYVEVNFGAFVILEGLYGPLGILSLFWKDEKEHPTKTKIMAELNIASQRLSTLLSSVKE